MAADTANNAPAPRPCLVRVMRVLRASARVVQAMLATYATIVALAALAVRAALTTLAARDTLAALAVPAALAALAGPGELAALDGLSGSHREY